MLRRGLVVPSRHHRESLPSYQRPENRWRWNGSQPVKRLLAVHAPRGCGGRHHRGGGGGQ